MKRGLVAKARAISTRRRSPPDKATEGEAIKKYPIRSIQIPDIDEAWIEREQKSMPVWKWAANYELQHVADTETIGAIDFIPEFTAKYFVAFIETGMK
jgi:hypothetical protein